MSLFDESIPMETRRRVRLRHVGEKLEQSADVLATDVVDDGARGTVVLEVTCRARCDGLTPPLLRLIATHGATVADVTARGEPAHPVATLR